MKKIIRKISLFICICVFVVISFNIVNVEAVETKSSDNTEEKIGNSQNSINENHPRSDGFWIQYFPLTTALRKNVILSDVIEPDATFENYEGDLISQHNLDSENPENYDNSHNHYQNFLSEVLNFQEGTNAVSIWGDSAAVVNGSKAWGGFFSARSTYKMFTENDEFKKYIPEGVDLNYTEGEYDAQLIGVEVDVLNEGKPGVYPNMSKTGVQIVGFGNPNSMAIEVRCEDTDKQEVAQANKKGVFESGIYFKNSIAEYGRLMVSDLKRARIGLDFSQTLFTEGAAKIKSDQIGTGIIYNDGNSGEIYGGKRWSETEDKNDWLTLRAGNGGIRIVSNDNTKELVAIDNYGGIYFNGDMYLNGTKVSSEEISKTVSGLKIDIIDIIELIVISLLTISIVALAITVLKMKREFNEMKKQFTK